MTNTNDDHPKISGDIESTSEARRAEHRADATRQIGAVMADLVDVSTHAGALERLLQIIANATGYSYALLAEMEDDALHMRVTAAYAPPAIVEAFAVILGTDLVGYRFLNDPAVAMKTPPTEVFSHISDFRPEIPREIGSLLGERVGLRHIAAIRQHTGDRYLGAVSFLATVDECRPGLCWRTCATATWSTRCAS